jgi:hypothetical protein
MSDLDDVFSKLLREAQAGDAGPKPKKNKAITYASDYAWRLESFTALVYATTCDRCGQTELTPGEIFKRSVGKLSHALISMTRITGLHELDSHPHLPRRVEVKRGTCLACPTCLGALSFTTTVEVPHGPKETP